jgi:hypothetical protein
MTTGVEETLAARWAWWHAEREQKLRAPYGWLSLTGLFWLTEQHREFPGVPGSWRVNGDKAEVSATASAGLVVSDRVLDGTADIALPEDGSTTFAGFGRAAIEMIVRAGRYGIRIRDPRSPLRSAFTGVPTFPVNSEWVITARLDRYPTPRELTIDTAQDGLVGVESAIGELRFRAGGADHSLIAFAGDDGITVVFSDATNGVSTASWRALWAETAPDADTVRLDFNRAVNMPSAFSDYGTCPKPPAGNKLGIAVEAGERTPVTG